MLEGTYAITGGDLGEERYNLDPASIVMVCITHIPTNAGIINPVDEIGTMIEDFNISRNREVGHNKPSTNNGIGQLLPPILYLVDACQSVGQIQVDVQKMKCHALAATGRKYLRGPRGTGFLYVPRHIANALEPSHVDHAAAPVLRVPVAPTCGSSEGWRSGLEGEGEFGLSHTYLRGVRRFEFWEASGASRLGLGAAMDAALDFGMCNIEKRCALLGGMLRTRLRAIDGVRLHHGTPSACGIVTFYVHNLDASIIKERMQNGAAMEHTQFYLSVAPPTSTSLDSSRTGLGDRRLVRASLSYFNTEIEIDLFCEALKKILDSS
mmetsp:Transcript_23387/g.56454  ORF Transcript_23387/g.56454 Transcript_23387/m.56454 type:complete len:323 (-) Transcript_23387:827-1795(-)